MGLDFDTARLHDTVILTGACLRVYNSHAYGVHMLAGYWEASSNRTQAAYTRNVGSKFHSDACDVTLGKGIQMALL